ncbi:hypothetical protein [Phaeovulum sp.]|uniref:hypothetical protein n=1 Tax=Phaeovulum sp. TaxID=2934796 RepID=UPI0039E63151
MSDRPLGGPVANAVMRGLPQHFGRADTGVLRPGAGDPNTPAATMILTSFHPDAGQYRKRARQKNCRSPRPDGPALKHRAARHTLSHTLFQLTISPVFDPLHPSVARMLGTGHEFWHSAKNLRNMP